MDFAALYTELNTDPLVRGYAAMTDEQLWTSLSTADRAVEKPTVTGAQIYNCIVPSDWTPLTDANKQLVRDIFGLGGDIDVRTGTNARTVLLAIFGAGSPTRTALGALVQRNISRLEEINNLDMTQKYLLYLVYNAGFGGRNPASAPPPT